MAANITQSHDPELLLLERAKVKFQENVAALLSVECLLTRKIRERKAQKKDFVILPMMEAELTTEHLRKIMTELLGSYEVMRTISQRHRLENRLYKKKETSFTEEQILKLRERVKQELEAAA